MRSGWLIWAMPDTNSCSRSIRRSISSGGDLVSVTGRSALTRRNALRTLLVLSANSRKRLFATPRTSGLMLFYADTFTVQQSINSPVSPIIIAETGSRAAPQWSSSATAESSWSVIRRFRRGDQEPCAHRRSGQSQRAGPRCDRIARDLAAWNGTTEPERTRSLHLHSRHARGAADRHSRELRLHSNALARRDRALRSRAHR